MDDSQTYRIRWQNNAEMTLGGISITKPSLHLAFEEATHMIGSVSPEYDNSIVIEEVKLIQVITPLYLLKSAGVKNQAPPSDIPLEPRPDWNESR